jgi:type IV pilus assembly protein PilO
MMEQLNKYRSAIILGTVVLFLLLFAWYILGLQPSNEKVKDQETEMARITGMNNLIQGKIDELKEAEDSNKYLQEDAADSLPEGDHTDQLILDLKSIEESSYAQLRDIQFTLSEMTETDMPSGAQGAVFSNIKKVQMSAKLEGGYTEIRQWMKQLQQLPRMVSIDSFSFSQPYEQRNPGSILQANVAFTAYYYLQ